MKLTELREDSDQSWAISEEDLDHVYRILQNKGELDQKDVKPLARELADEYDGFSRTPGSAQFIINRMHVILHGMAPTGYSEHSAEAFMQPAKPLIDFMRKKGHDVEEAIYQAQDEARTRVAKLKREPAVAAVIDYYKKQRGTLSPPQDKAIRTQKEQLIQAVMNGMKVEDAFAQVM